MNYNQPVIDSEPHKKVKTFRPDDSVADENFLYTDTRIYSPDLELLRKNRIVSALTHNNWLESFKMLRTRTLQIMDERGWNTLAITSPNDDSGNSLTAVNLAISMAMELDRTVLLVDANFKNPSVHTLLGINSTLGLGDYLLHNTPLSEMLINPDIPRLVILPAGKPMLNSTEMLRSPKMINFVNEVKSRYPSRIIIFDIPPLLTQVDALSFSPYVDCVLLVIEEGRTKKEDLQHAATLLKDVKLIGTVYNKSNEKKIKYSQ
ncbi:MAG: CpsD/CapB family tyrosine-protein kinase [Methylobacter sp.]|nr:CpsD/CapB family tyrosine-protein kinase [Methylobacter sp.]